MKILIVGSISSPQDSEHVENFKRICRDIGVYLARAKHEIIVASENPNTADYYVVEGARSVKGRHRLTILRSEGTRTSFESSVSSLRENFYITWRPILEKKIATRLPEVIEADGIILIAGGDGTEQIGYIAPLLKKPVIAIPSLGGAASKVSSYLEYNYLNIPDIRSDLDMLYGVWENEIHAKICISLLKKIQHNDNIIPQKPLPKSFLLILVSFMIALWVWVFTTPFASSTISLFALLGISALIGTGLRTALRQVEEKHKILSANYFLNEVSASLALSFSLALIYIAGGFTVTGKMEFINLLNNPIDFARVSITMTLLGIVGGLSIERASQSVVAWLNNILPFKENEANLQKEI